MTNSELSEFCYKFIIIWPLNNEPVCIDGLVFLRLRLLCDDRIKGLGKIGWWLCVYINEINAAVFWPA